ncbi:MAG: glycoside hydrolase family 9 protein, partial [Bacteroidota bacterium]
MAKYSSVTEKCKGTMRLEKQMVLYFRLALISFLVFTVCSTWLKSYGATNSIAGKNVFINQIGYLPGELKRVITDQSAKGFTVVEEETGQNVFTAKLKPIKDLTTNKRIWVGDFTLLSKPGKYRIKVAGVGNSYPFVIDSNIYTQVLNLAMRSYYLQRCGTTLKDEETGLSHPQCHSNDGVIARKDNYYEAGQQLPCIGGWHDAGDYGKYTTTTTVTVAQMLVAYELWPEKFSDGQFRIPESGNGIPDILDEARVGLEWLLTMQRPDGAVYHKLAGSRWPSFVSPDDEYQTRFIYGISTADTGKFAATMAIAARVWKNTDKQFANRVYQAS